MDISDLLTTDLPSVVQASGHRRNNLPKSFVEAMKQGILEKAAIGKPFGIDDIWPKGNLKPNPGWDTGDGTRDTIQKRIARLRAEVGVKLKPERVDCKVPLETRKALKQAIEANPYDSNVNIMTNLNVQVDTHHNLNAYASYVRQRPFKTQPLKKWYEHVERSNIPDLLHSELPVDLQTILPRGEKPWTYGVVNFEKNIESAYFEVTSFTNVTSLAELKIWVAEHQRTVNNIWSIVQSYVPQSGVCTYQMRCKCRFQPQLPAKASACGQESLCILVVLLYYSSLGT